MLHDCLCFEDLLLFLDIDVYRNQFKTTSFV